MKRFINAVKQTWSALSLMSEAVYGSKKLSWLGPVGFVYGWILFITTMMVWLTMGWKAMLITWGIGLLIGSPWSIIGIHSLYKMRKSVEQQ